MTKPKQSALRLGVFGGTFDPPHLGHLMIAERAREELALTRVIFVPSFISPHKQAGSVASPRDRARMITLAIRGHDKFELSLHEIVAKSVSYTVDTLEFLHREYPAAELYFLLGEDNLPMFRSWKASGRILELARLAVYHRGKPVDRRMCRGMLQRIEWLTGNTIPISSSEIRQRRLLGRSIRYLVPEPVRAHILKHTLYRSPDLHR